MQARPRDSISIMVKVLRTTKEDPHHTVVDMPAGLLSTKTKGLHTIREVRRRKPSIRTLGSSKRCAESPS